MESVFVAAALVCLLPYLNVAAISQAEALYALRTSLNASDSQLSDWNEYQVDPCTWTNVQCDTISKTVLSVTLSSMGFSGKLPPEIGILNTLTSLELQGNQITGKIPDEIGNLSSLTSLELENNRLTGGIPSSIGNLKNLQYLSLNNNNLSGTIPGSLSNLGNLISLQLGSNQLIGEIPPKLFQIAKYNFTANKLKCGDPHRLCAVDSSSPGSTDKATTRVIVGVIGGLFGVLLISSFLFLFYKRRYKRYVRQVFVDVPGEFDCKITFGQLRKFTYRELQIATDNFSEKNVLGQGGFGKVYKGVLADKNNTVVAVKRLTDCQSPGGDAAFQREVEMISVAVHRNLLRLMGYCTTPTERLLVYPFMQNLSVASCLRDLKPGEPVLDWPTRKRIALGTARGLEYLHEHCNPKIIHRDVKAANVLLDEDFEAVVGDFGLAKLVDVAKTNVTTRVRGTMGHIAPEYISTGKSSVKTDVFGYGVTLLEVVTGQSVFDFSRFEEDDEILLLHHVMKMARERRLDRIVDRNLNMNYDEREAEMLIQVALLCTQNTPDERPTMSQVVRMLEGERLAETWHQWQYSEVLRRQQSEKIKFSEDSTCNLEAIELSGGR